MRENCLQTYPHICLSPASAAECWWGLNTHTGVNKHTRTSPHAGNFSWGRNDPQESKNNNNKRINCLALLPLFYLNKSLKN